MLEMSTSILPITYNANSGVHSTLVSGSSLFLGLGNGDIEEWDEPGEVRRTLKGHTNTVYSLLQCENVLWSSSFDKTIKWWNIHTGECINTIKVNAQIFKMCM